MKIIKGIKIGGLQQKIFNLMRFFLVALILGIPTAISYDVVRVGESYGSVFELLNVRSFAKILANEPEKLDWCVEEYVKMLRLIHGTLVPAGKLPDMKKTALSWVRFLRDYLPAEASEKLIALVETVPHDARMIRRSIRRKGLESETGWAEIEHWKSELLALLDRTDTLTFDRNELELEAVRENLDEVAAFLEERLDATDCTPKARMQINLAVEEIFVNIASYAYNPDTGKATVRVEVSDEPVSVSITFVDHGVPYDPLARQDPDVSLSAEERNVGGLGIFLTKQVMDEASYEYKHGQNILRIRKKV